MTTLGSQLPVIAITVGEPSGIGAEVLIKALQSGFDAHLVIIGDIKHLQNTAERLSFNVTFSTWTGRDHLPAQPSLSIVEVRYPEPVIAGSLNPSNATVVVESLKIAHELATSKAVDAIFTGPVHKGVINDSGLVFSGHTEYFAQQAKCEQVVMMLANDIMRVTLVTTHLPLKDVAGSITKPKLRKVLNIIHQSLSRLLGSKPRIGVLGLNPHAGEQGHMGTEEIDIIEPVISECEINQGMQITGPLPADTAFQAKYLKNFDVILAMYHDQGLPVLKYSGFGNSVNVTLGLPYLRASVDHGTALDIAGKNIADPSSFIYALNYTIQLVSQKATV